jgi:DNA damage-binding protein 1
LDRRLIFISIPEHNLLSLSFLPTTDANAPPVLALLHRTYTHNPQLLAHSLHTSSFELSTTYSPLLQPTLLSKVTFPTSVENPPILLPISPRSDDETDFDPSKEVDDNGMSEDTVEFEGGVLILGGRRIMLYPLAPTEWQESFKAKTTRQSKRKSTSRADTTRTREEMKQHDMKRQPAASVEWPFGEITA